MSIVFDPIEPQDVKMFFNEFFNELGVFFEIISNDVAIGFYGVKSITEKVCEISIYLNEKGRLRTTKQLALKCLKFPFSLGFDKAIIRTELEKLYRFCSKMTKYGVKYLFKHNDIHFFEVLP